MSLISPQTLRNRHQKLAQALEQSEFQALLVNPSPTISYLTGMHFHLSERPVLLFFAPGVTPAIALPELEAGKTADLPYQLNVFTYSENPDSWGAAFQAAAASLNLGEGLLGVESRSIRALELWLLEAAIPGAQFADAADVVGKLRMYKDEAEIAAMRQAAQIAQQALLATMPKMVVGATEQEIAGELTAQLLQHGSQPLLPFSPIVASGPNSANPHAFPTDRKLQEGDLLIIDWGATVEGYLSDITRTFAVGEVDEENQRIHEVVLLANQAARGIVAPGVACAAVDKAARDAIEDNGYGQYFIHRTGHGLGMEGHEAPYIRGDNAQALAFGMTFTIEPGVYLPGKGGVRIEDDVLVTEFGIESFTDLPRELIRVG